MSFYLHLLRTVCDCPILAHEGKWNQFLLAIYVWCLSWALPLTFFMLRKPFLRWEVIIIWQDDSSLLNPKVVAPVFANCKCLSNSAIISVILFVNRNAFFYFLSSFSTWVSEHTILDFCQCMRLWWLALIVNFTQTSITQWESQWGINVDSMRVYSDRPVDISAEIVLI